MNNPQKEDELMWVLIAFGLLAVGIWLIGHEDISRMMMALRRFESLFMVFDPEGKVAISQWVDTADPRKMALSELWASGEIVGRTIRWGVAILLTMLFAMAIKRSPECGMRYSRKYTTDTLSAQESVIWPVIKPVLGQNYTKVDLDHPINGMRARPRDYARQHGMLSLAAGIDPAEISDIDIIGHEALRLSKARTIFTKQLGALWPGVHGLRPYERALFAACAAQINNNNDLAIQIIEDLAEAYLLAKKTRQVNLVDSPLALKALNNYINTQPVQRIISHHAYIRTVLMSMLTQARRNGSLPPNWFRWLKTTDRVTWYALNDLGLDVASVEAAGIRAHWNAEIAAKSAIANPMIEPAIIGLKIALEELLDDSQLDDE